MPKVLIADELSPAAVQIFRQRGVEVDEKVGLKPKELREIIGEYDGLAIRSATKVTPEVIAVAKKLKELMIAHQGLLLACPEYNTSITGVLKNAIDWASRAEKGEPALAAFDGKVAGLLSASPGAFGGIRSLMAVRSILSNIRVLVIPEQQAVPKANEAFGPDGKLLDAKLQAGVAKVAQRLVAVTAALARPL